jgi:hypothetical protein
MSKMSEYAETLYDILPCDSYEECRDGMSVVWPGITVEIVNNVVHWVRSNPDEAGYNISYIKRGTPGAGESNRLYVINKDDPTFRFSEEQREHFDNGVLMTVKTMNTFAVNQVEMLIAGQVHEAGRVAREALEDLQYQFEGFVRSMRRARRIITEKMNGTS